ncbi:Fe-S cluster assembly sulfur transfer protein SufU [Cellulomonas sp. SLBN-39]|uniref:Fe-S cluster assembly sulfur transfer protein SufU n=1 Tax=Cellulomonas sp. SLBN-39 TaxID=2768446 RepID=UPI0011670465|nr:SUF system NifU family Fe-S cluster assembly protein [Cellulomonas sp. SLBN-39]TQL04368.1 nitrogen fixation NifU-like protein [Cellulomonas sp. SLBN-39]
MTSSSMEQLYQQVILDHAKFPHGRGLPEGAGTVGVAVVEHGTCAATSHQVNPTCGDEVTMRVDVDTTGPVPVVRDVAWEGQGCSISQASISVLHDLVVGQDLAAVDHVHTTFRALMQSKGAGLDDDAEELLGDAAAFTGVSRYAARVKCALLGWAALTDALITSGARTQEDA